MIWPTDGISTSGKVKVLVDFFSIPFSPTLIRWCFMTGFIARFFFFHRLLSKRFPYAIYYQIETGSGLVVYRVLDCRQNPRKTRMALKSGG